MSVKGILLINLGTPDSYAPKDVKRYLTEFLTDPRVIDLPTIQRHLLVRGLIIPKRYKASAAAYREIWREEGSPLLYYGECVKKKLQASLGEQYIVELAMRYQNPSIKKGLAQLLKQGVNELIVVPLFPQYASATTGSVYEKTMQELARYQVLPRLRFINQFADYPPFIEAFAAKAKKMLLGSYDHILFSFHGLPERQLKKADGGKWCLQKKNCCQRVCPENKDCYSAQCHKTMQALASKLALPAGRYSICFQSRLGKDPWLQPYASETIKKMAAGGYKKILVFAPSFVCDCLETLFEYGVEYQKEFQAEGGKQLDLVEGLNDDDLWVGALQKLILCT